MSTTNYSKLKKLIKTKSVIIRAIPMPPIRLGKGPIAIFPANKKVKSFFDKIGETIEIKNEKLSKNFWAISGTMASFYELLNVLSLDEPPLNPNQSSPINWGLPDILAPVSNPDNILTSDEPDAESINSCFKYSTRIFILCKETKLCI